MNAEIISVGTELLLGDIVNTNAQYLSRELANLGINVYRQTVVGDNEERILESFERAFENSDIIVTTGGLGPTPDDLTKEVAAKYFKQELVLHEESYKKLESYFKNNGRGVTESNKKQAYFPKEAIILKNNHGTAPGAILEGEKGKKIIILPGPPKEMKPMFDEQVIPYLKKFTDNVLVSKTLRLFGIGESHMAEEIKEIIDAQTNPTIAPYAKDVDVTLRITAKGKNEEDARKLIIPMEKKVRDKLGEFIYGEGETTLEEVVAKMLVDKKITISTAESCTGGMIASKLINYGGISECFLEGAVTYSNEAKANRLGVKKETLERYGAVSEETAKEMAEGVAKTSGTDIGVSTTGIAGPTGGTKEKPVGLVYVGISYKGKTIAKRFEFQGDRNKVRIRTTMNALNIIRKTISEE
ncbi:competence/damage-inducible protein A [Clostridium sp. 'White wine YQ']|uniref:competence/damage-inducible protein A n=1 Tax=Clostridium sp. 'White wine YQ' TaxID=3027474 RepID=UPI0023653109|nr:competence/damage-inducible protein A [Clostridium sp. 'White wine YQ']MDD7796298.1 competence/damage-inducible protein A [Clostridium sp. 'White wine YQ']